MRTKLLLPLLTLAQVAPGQTTTLDFTGLIGTSALSHGYGDRVSGASSGGFNYPGSGTYTPNVLASFGSYEAGTSQPALPWTLGYNDLVDVVYGAVSGFPGGGAELRVTLTADPGHLVDLRSFDIGNGYVAFAVPYVRVTDESDTVLFEEMAVALAPSTSPAERNFVLNPAPVGRILTLRISLEGLGFLGQYVGLDNVTFGQRGGSTAEVGTTYCAPAVANSSGGAAALRAWGDDVVQSNDLRLVATGLPLASYGFFLASRSQGQVMGPGGSQGVLCLGGAIGRFVGSGQIVNSTTAGNFALDLDLAALPTPTGPVAAAAGETWNFTAWFRDANPSPTSNFTDAISVLWR